TAMPGMRCIDSARLRSGKSAMSSAKIESTTPVEFFLRSSAVASDWRYPVTMMFSITPALCSSCAMAPGADRAAPMAAHTADTRPALTCLPFMKGPLSRRHELEHRCRLAAIAARAVMVTPVSLQNDAITSWIGLQAEISTGHDPDTPGHGRKCHRWPACPGRAAGPPRPCRAPRPRAWAPPCRDTLVGARARDGRSGARALLRVPCCRSTKTSAHDARRQARGVHPDGSAAARSETGLPLYPPRSVAAHE